MDGYNPNHPLHHNTGIPPNGIPINQNMQAVYYSNPDYANYPSGTYTIVQPPPLPPPSLMIGSPPPPMYQAPYSALSPLHSHPMTVMVPMPPPSNPNMSLSTPSPYLLHAVAPPPMYNSSSGSSSTSSGLGSSTTNTPTSTGNVSISTYKIPSVLLLTDTEVETVREWYIKICQYESRMKHSPIGKEIVFPPIQAFIPRDYYTTFVTDLGMFTLELQDRLFEYSSLEDIQDNELRNLLVGYSYSKDTEYIQDANNFQLFYQDLYTIARSYYWLPQITVEETSNMLRTIMQIINPIITRYNKIIANSSALTLTFFFDVIIPSPNFRQSIRNLLQSGKGNEAMNSKTNPFSTVLLVLMNMMKKGSTLADDETRQQVFTGIVEDLPDNLKLVMETNIVPSSSVSNIVASSLAGNTSSLSSPINRNKVTSPSSVSSVPSNSSSDGSKTSNQLSMGKPIVASGPSPSGTISSVPSVSSDGGKVSTQSSMGKPILTAGASTLTSPESIPILPSEPFVISADINTGSGPSLLGLSSLSSTSLLTTSITGTKIDEDVPLTHSHTNDVLSMLDSLDLGMGNIDEPLSITNAKTFSNTNEGLLDSFTKPSGTTTTTDNNLFSGNLFGTSFGLSTSLTAGSTSATLDFSSAIQQSLLTASVTNEVAPKVEEPPIIPSTETKEPQNTKPKVSVFSDTKEEPKIAPVTKTAEVMNKEANDIVPAALAPITGPITAAMIAEKEALASKLLAQIGLLPIVNIGFTDSKIDVAKIPIQKLFTVAVEDRMAKFMGSQPTKRNKPTSSIAPSFDPDSFCTICNERGHTDSNCAFNASVIVKAGEISDTKQGFEEFSMPEIYSKANTTMNILAVPTTSHHDHENYDDDDNYDDDIDEGVDDMPEYLGNNKFRFHNEDNDTSASKAKDNEPYVIEPIKAVTKGTATSKPVPVASTTTTKSTTVNATATTKAAPVNVSTTAKPRSTSTPEAIVAPIVSTKPKVEIPTTSIPATKEKSKEESNLLKLLTNAVKRSTITTTDEPATSAVKRSTKTTDDTSILPTYDHCTYCMYRGSKKQAHNHTLETCIAMDIVPLLIRTKPRNYSNPKESYCDYCRGTSKHAHDCTALQTFRYIAGFYRDDKVELYKKGINCSYCSIRGREAMAYLHSTRHCIYNIADDRPSAHKADIGENQINLHEFLPNVIKDRSNEYLNSQVICPNCVVHKRPLLFHRYEDCTYENGGRELICSFCGNFGHMDDNCGEKQRLGEQVSNDGSSKGILPNSITILSRKNKVSPDGLHSPPSTLSTVMNPKVIDKMVEATRQVEVEKSNTFDVLYENETVKVSAPTKTRTTTTTTNNTKGNNHNGKGGNKK